MKTPLLSTIVLNYRTPRDAIRCVQALQRQTIADRMEILIVDNHSRDESVQWLRNTFSSPSSPSSALVRFLETPRNLGYGQGNALAIRHAEGEYLLIINPDNELEPDGAEKMIAMLEGDASIGIVAPRLRHQDGSLRDSYRTFPTVLDLLIKRTALQRLFSQRMRRYLQHGAEGEHPRGVDWVAGACLLLRRSFYEELGGFDPRFFLFFEDTDLCRRCWESGKRVVYAPRISATDRKHRLSEGGILSLLTKRTVRIHLRSAVKYFWKWRRIH